MFLFGPAAKSSKAYKFARLCGGLYRIVCLYQNGAEVLPVDKPQKAAIRVALNRLGYHSIGPVDALVVQATHDPLPHWRPCIRYGLNGDSCMGQSPAP